MDSSGKAQAILKWLQDGSQLEDSPTCRASNHFHNPLRPFTASGVTDLPSWIQAYCAFGPYGRITSNVTWGTRFTAPGVKGSETGNRMDWDAARRAYFEALTKSDSRDREAALAETFKALGQVVHLVQDLAVPAHARNDFRSHLQYFAPQLTESPTRWASNAFEHFVRLHPDLVASAGALPIASLDRPVTRFWDTDQYTGGNPSADTDQGLAEYTNANFASQNTIFTEALGPANPYTFPYPRESSTNLADLLAHRLVARQVLAEDGITDLGLYLWKHADGENIFPFLKVGYLADYLQSVLTLRPYLRLSFQLDDEVHAAYAAHLLPRAVGYSTGLLDYFFRGKLDFEINLDDLDPTDPTRLPLVIKNGGLELMTGEFTIYAEDTDGKRDAVTSAQRTVGGGSISDPVRFTPPRDIEKLILVFQGTLGQEEGAVAGVVKPWVPYVFAIQESTALTAEEERTDRVDLDTAGYFYETLLQSKNAGKQRASGRFFVQGKPEAGKYLKRAWLDFDFGGAFTSGMWLRFDDQDVGPEWNRDTSPVQDPSRWEVVVDLPAPAHQIGYRQSPSGSWVPMIVWDLPRFLVLETVAGTRFKAPLVWWGSSSSLSTVRSQSDVDRCPPEEEIICFRILETSSSVTGSAFFGDGDPDGRDVSPTGEWYPLTAPHTAVRFTPIGEVAGYGVGTVESSNNFPSSGICLPAGEYAGRDARVFVLPLLDGTLVWNKNDIAVGRSRWTVTRTLLGTGHCLRPDPILPEPPPLATLTFKRDYLPAEQELFQVLNITPPDYEFTLD